MRGKKAWQAERQEEQKNSGCLNCQGLMETRVLSSEMLTWLKKPGWFQLALYALFQCLLRLQASRQLSASHSSWMKAVTHLLKLCSCLQLAWQNAVSPQPETEMELKETRDKYRETCITLANYYVMADNAKEWKLALPYYRMSQQPVFKILTQSKLLWMKEGEGNRVTRIPPGLIHYMVEVILNPLPCEDVLEASLADLIIDLLGEYALQVCPSCFTSFWR